MRKNLILVPTKVRNCDEGDSVYILDYLTGEFNRFTITCDSEESLGADSFVYKIKPPKKRKNAKTYLIYDLDLSEDPDPEEVTRRYFYQCIKEQKRVVLEAEEKKWAREKVKWFNEDMRKYHYADINGFSFVISKGGNKNEI